MNRYESEQWAKSDKLQVIRSLRENGSGLSRALKQVIGCDLSTVAKQELQQLYEREHARIERYISDSGH
jgi:hypothetical protein